MAARLIMYLACTLLVLVSFATKSDAFGNGPTATCPNGQTWCHKKKMILVRTYQQFFAFFRYFAQY